jgi:hypothetical protein
VEEHGDNVEVHGDNQEGFSGNLRPSGALQRASPQLFL